MAGGSPTAERLLPFPRRSRLGSGRGSASYDERMHHATLIPGDGIGPEVAAATRLVLDATGVVIDWTQAEAGAGALERTGTTLPDSTMDAIRACRVALKGPI